MAPSASPIQIFDLIKENLLFLNVSRIRQIKGAIYTVLVYIAQRRLLPIKYLQIYNYTTYTLLPWAQDSPVNISISGIMISENRKHLRTIQLTQLEFGSCILLIKNLALPPEFHDTTTIQSAALISHYELGLSGNPVDPRFSCRFLYRRFVFYMVSRVACHSQDIH